MEELKLLVRVEHVELTEQIEERPNKTPLTNRRNATHRINIKMQNSKHRCTRKHGTVKMDRVKEVEHIDRVK